MYSIVPLFFFFSLSGPFAPKSFCPTVERHCLHLVYCLAHHGKLSRRSCASNSDYSPFRHLPTSSSLSFLLRTTLEPNKSED
ncbi:hypothetical protein GGR58DRAFT_81170 [Xylaria digitata]|nr:hypothetical protein GGR58DRAFT_81170 [Xylaria digitata]